MLTYDYQGGVWCRTCILPIFRSLCEQHGVTRDSEGLVLDWDRPRSPHRTDRIREAIVTVRGPADASLPGPPVYGTDRYASHPLFCVDCREFLRNGLTADAQERFARDAGGYSATVRNYYRARYPLLGIPVSASSPPAERPINSTIDNTQATTIMPETQAPPAAPLAPGIEVSFKLKRGPDGLTLTLKTSPALETYFRTRSNGRTVNLRTANGGPVVAVYEGVSVDVDDYDVARYLFMVGSSTEEKVARLPFARTRESMRTLAQQVRDYVERVYNDEIRAFEVEAIVRTVASGPVIAPQ